MKVTIAGGGVAALEALVALRRLAEERVELELVTPTPEFVYRPLAVAEPFGVGKVRRFDLVHIARMQNASMHLAGVGAVRPDEHLIETWDGRSLEYEILVLATGADSITAVPGAVTMKGPGYTGRFRTVLRELEERQVTKVAFAVPATTSWPLPLYELALMTAKRVRDRGLRKVELSLVTPEAEPLEIFGSRAARAVRTLLDESGIALHTECSPRSFDDGRLAVVPGDAFETDRVVSLPRLRGPFLPGLPHDHEGFLPVDSHQYVGRERDVYAAGDATTCPIKQGGIAAQQADAAAESIAARAGAPIDPRPFRPVLRGLLLTGSAPRYMRADVSGAEDSSEISEHTLWWPPGKIAGRYLAPTLALDELDHPPRGMAVSAEVGSGGTPAGGWRRLHVSGR